MQAVQIGMDRKDRERELVSALLSSLHRTTISQEEMAKGFTRLLLFTEVRRRKRKEEKRKEKKRLDETRLHLLALI